MTISWNILVSIFSGHFSCSHAASMTDHKNWHHELRSQELGLVLGFISGLFLLLSSQSKHILETSLAPAQDKIQWCPAMHTNGWLCSKNKLKRLTSPKRRKKKLGITFALSHHRPLPACGASRSGQECHARSFSEGGCGWVSKRSRVELRQVWSVWQQQALSNSFSLALMIAPHIQGIKNCELLWPSN